MKRTSQNAYKYLHNILDISRSTAKLLISMCINLAWYKASSILHFQKYITKLIFDEIFDLEVWKDKVIKENNDVLYMDPAFYKYVYLVWAPHSIFPFIPDLSSSFSQPPVCNWTTTLLFLYIIMYVIKSHQDWRK